MDGSTFGLAPQMFRRRPRWLRGYSIEDVDRFFARLSTERVTRAEIDRVVFRVAWGGYAEKAVDEALEQAKAALPYSDPELP